MGKRSIGTRNIQKENKLNFTHKDLCYDLAEAKGTKFIEVPLGSVWLNRYEGPGQADVITIKPSYNRFNLDIYEVKVTRSDFLQDIRKHKYEKYLPHCNRLYFAVKSGICKKEEIPDSVGLIVRGEKGWSTIKTAKKRDVVFEQQMMLSLLFFNGRVYNKGRIDKAKKAHHVNNTYYVNDLKFLGKQIRDKILKYNILLRNYRNLLNIASDRIPFIGAGDKEAFEDKWDNGENKLIY